MAQPSKNPILSACYYCASFALAVYLVMLSAQLVNVVYHYSLGNYAYIVFQDLPSDALADLLSPYNYDVRPPLYLLKLSHLGVYLGMGLLIWHWRRCAASPPGADLPAAVFRCALSLGGGYYALLALLQLRWAVELWLMRNQPYSGYSHDYSLAATLLHGGLLVLPGLVVLMAAGPIAQLWTQGVYRRSHTLGAASGER